MADTRADLPYANTALAKYISDQIDSLTRIHGVSQRELAAQMGYDRPNIISMFKAGSARVPLDRIPAMAKALQVDPGHLFRLALEQYWPDNLATINQLWRNLASANEIAMLKLVRQWTSETDPEIPREAVLRFLAEAFPNGGKNMPEEGGDDEPQQADEVKTARKRARI